jgi:hypothetical protein
LLRVRFQRSAVSRSYLRLGASICGFPNFHSSHAWGFSTLAQVKLALAYGIAPELVKPEMGRVGHMKRVQHFIEFSFGMADLRVEGIESGVKLPIELSQALSLPARDHACN